MTDTFISLFDLSKILRNEDVLNEFFECCYEDLQKRYPNATLIASDIFGIDVVWFDELNNDLYDLQFITGASDGYPCVKELC